MTAEVRGADSQSAVSPLLGTLDPAAASVSAGVRTRQTESPRHAGSLCYMTGGIMMRRLRLALWVAILSMVAPAQTVIRTETRLVLVDAIVRDKNGKTVSDLGIGDFRLWEDGKAQPVTSLSLESAGPPDRPEAQYLVFLFDGVAAGEGARQAVADFAGAYASPNRYMAVVNVRGTLSIAQNFTAIAERVQRAAADVAGVPAGGADAPRPATDLNSLIANPATDPYMASWVLRQAQQQVQIAQNARPLPLLNAIGALADGMAAIRGRKSVVVISGSTALDPPSWQGEAVARACNRANVAVYGANGALRILAQATGGRAISKNLVDELGAIVDDQEKRYVLGFKPVESPNGSCHSLRVQTTRGGLDVRARTGYCNDKLPDLLAGKVKGKDLEARAAGPSAGNASASMELPYFYSSAGIALVDLAMEMDLANLAKQTSKPHADLDLVGLAYGPDGEVAGRFSDTVRLDLDTPQALDAFSRQPYHYEHQFRLPSGRYNVRLAFGSGDRNFGKVEGPLTIDAWDGRHLALSGIALASEARKAPDLTSDLDPSLLDGRKDLTARSLEISPSGGNRFPRSAPCFGYLEIYEPMLAGPNPPTIGLEIRILDRRTGEQKEAGTLSAADYIRPGNPVVPVLLKAPIASLPPGSYVLEVKASRSPGEDYVVRTVEFEVSEKVAKVAGDNGTGDAVSQPESALPAPPSPAVPSAADAKPAFEPEQDRFLAAARQKALDYAGWLPNFLCTQTVHRSVLRDRSIHAIADTLTVEVGYYEQQERYRLAAINGIPTAIEYEDAWGTISQGEFGTNLRTIFDPASDAAFHFERWTTLRGRRAAAYSYRVERSKAHYPIATREGDKVVREHVGLRGEAVIDLETFAVLRLNYMADDIPPGFPVRRTNVTVDYGDAEIGGARYLLPLKALVELRDKSSTSDNEVTFHSYRKFSTDSSISFAKEEPKP